jgi:integral membrane sensor domain MASE1
MEIVAITALVLFIILFIAMLQNMPVGKSKKTFFVLLPMFLTCFSLFAVATMFIQLKQSEDNQKERESKKLQAEK